MKDNWLRDALETQVHSAEEERGWLVESRKGTKSALVLN